MFLVLLTLYINVFISYMQGWVVADEVCWTPVGNIGTCISIDRCELMVYILKNTPAFEYDRVKQQLRAYSCENQEEFPRLRLHGLVSLITHSLPDIFTNKRDPNKIEFVCCPSSNSIYMNNNLPGSLSLLHNSNVPNTGLSRNDKKVLLKNPLSSPDMSNQQNIGLMVSNDRNSSEKPLSPQDVSNHQNAGLLQNKGGDSPVPLPKVLNHPNVGLLLRDGGGAFEKPLPPANVSNHPNLRLLPSDCGPVLNTDNRITNGHNADINEFPWMALLSYKTNDVPKFDCGGTIINERYILTAAHCLSYLPYPLLGVRVGEYNIDTKEDCVNVNGKKKCTPGVQDLSIEQIIPHPEYNHNTKLNDIGLLRVSRINLGVENIKPVCLPLGLAKHDDIKFGIVTGWGFTDILKDTKSPILQKVNIPIVDLDKCTEVYKKIPKAPPITFKHICAGGKNKKDSCTGDSGGPLHAPNVANDNTVYYVQYGIVSYGPRVCGTEGVPGVYTNVAYYMDWILDQLKP